MFVNSGLNNEEYQAVIGNDTTSHIVDDLEPARNYTFYIVAYMPMGASRMSEQVTQHTLEDGECSIVNLQHRHFAFIGANMECSVAQFQQFRTLALHA